MNPLDDLARAVAAQQAAVNRSMARLDRANRVAEVIRLREAYIRLRPPRPAPEPARQPTFPQPSPLLFNVGQGPRRTSEEAFALVPDEWLERR